MVHHTRRSDLFLIDMHAHMSHIDLRLNKPAGRPLS
jgi:hypothetical protein